VFICPFRAVLAGAHRRRHIRFADDRLHFQLDSKPLLIVTFPRPNSLSFDATAIFDATYRNAPIQRLLPGINHLPIITDADLRVAGAIFWRGGRDGAVVGVYQAVGDGPINLVNLQQKERSVGFNHFE